MSFKVTKKATKKVPAKKALKKSSKYTGLWESLKALKKGQHLIIVPDKRQPCATVMRHINAAYHRTKPLGDSKKLTMFTTEKDELCLQVVPAKKGKKA